MLASIHFHNWGQVSSESSNFEYGKLFSLSQSIQIWHCIAPNVPGVSYSKQYHMWFELKCHSLVAMLNIICDICKFQSLLVYFVLYIDCAYFLLPSSPPPTPHPPLISLSSRLFMSGHTACLPSGTWVWTRGMREDSSSMSLQSSAKTFRYSFLLQIFVKSNKKKEINACT